MIEKAEQRVSKWVNQKVESLFAGRKGHGGGRCTYRTFRPSQLRDVLQEAFECGRMHSSSDVARLESDNARMREALEKIYHSHGLESELVELIERVLDETGEK